MPAGKHDKRVDIQTAAETTDAGGNAVLTWTTAESRWASIEDQAGRELYRAQQVDPTVSAVITLREDYTGLAPDDRIVFGSRTFNIKAVLGRDDRTPRRGQIVHCTEEV